MTLAGASPDVQYRVVFGKKDELVEGSDDAALVISVGVLDARNDPAESFMRGALKATGSSRRLFEVLRSGEAASVLSRLASRP